jgi:hypothetical protein
VTEKVNGTLHFAQVAPLEVNSHMTTHCIPNAACIVLYMHTFIATTRRLVSLTGLIHGVLIVRREDRKQVFHDQSQPGFEFAYWGSCGITVN